MGSFMILAGSGLELTIFDIKNGFSAEKGADSYPVAFGQFRHRATLALAKWPQEAPRRPQDGPKLPQDDPNIAQDVSKMTPRCA